MEMRLIGAGFGRTGTLSLKNALEKIGYGPCYHMMEVVIDARRGRAWLEQTRNGSLDWDVIFDGFQATVDWPAAAYWRELIERYPEAKVLLSLRDPDRWHKSMMNTIYQGLMKELPENAPEAAHEFKAMVTELVLEKTFQGRLKDRDYATKVFEAHNQAVIDAVPASRLLVYQPGEGWEPICRFLDVPVPDEEYPHLNDTAQYRKMSGLSSD